MPSLARPLLQPPCMSERRRPWGNAPTAERGCFTSLFDAHVLPSVLIPPAGRPALREKGNDLVMSLANVQLALGQGYLSAFPATHFDRLQALTPVWAPYYVVRQPLLGHRLCHSIDMLAGHLHSVHCTCTVLACVRTGMAWLWVGQDSLQATHSSCHRGLSQAGCKVTGRKLSTERCPHR